MVPEDKMLAAGAARGAVPHQGGLDDAHRQALRVRRRYLPVALAQPAECLADALLLLLAQEPLAWARRRRRQPLGEIGERLLRQSQQPRLLAAHVPPGRLDVPAIERHQ